MHELAAPPELLAVWRTFDGFPMETLSKARVYAREGPRQRSVAELEADRARYGASGNCFDLALWLRHRLRAAGFVAEVISDDIGDRDAHVAVLAQTGAGRRYLCDLGDMWLQPIAVDAPVLEPVPWFFPAARVTLRCDGPRRVVTMHRPGGKRAAQRYDLTPVGDEALARACAANQEHLAQALVEVRDPARDAHWEYDGGVARWSAPSGLTREPALADEAAEAARIAARTGMAAGYVLECLQAFATHRGDAT